MPFNYIPRIISPSECIGNSLSTINLGLSSLDLNLEVLSSFVMTNIPILSAKVTTLSLASANWNSTFNTVSSTSARWTNTYLTVAANSAQWALDTSGGITILQTTSANWNSTYTVVSANSANWNNVYATVTANSAQWAIDTTGACDLTEIQLLSADWQSNYSTVNVNSGNWLTQTLADSYYVNISGDTMTGGLSAPSLSTNNLYVGASTIYFMDNHSIVENLKSIDVANFKSTYSTVTANSANWNIYANNASDIIYVRSNSANWNSGYTTVYDNSSNWQNVYATVTANSAQWAIDTLGDLTGVESNSANWNSNYTTTNTNSANWNYATTVVQSNSANWGADITLVNSNSANWQNNYTTVYDNSSNWQNVYATVTANSAQWAIDLGGEITSIQGLTANWEAASITVGNTSANWVLRNTTNIFTSGQIISANNYAYNPALQIVGNVFAGGNSHTTKPQVLIEGVFPLSAVTGVASTNIFTAFSLGIMANNDPIVFKTLNGGSNLSVDTVYYVRDKSGSTFKVASAYNGLVHNLGTDVTAGSMFTRTGVWDISGTMLGINAPVGFTGTYLDIQKAGISQLRLTQNSADFQFVVPSELHFSVLNFLDDVDSNAQSSSMVLTDSQLEIYLENVATAGITLSSVRGPYVGKLWCAPYLAAPDTGGLVSNKFFAAQDKSSTGASNINSRFFLSNSAGSTHYGIIGADISLSGIQLGENTPSSSTPVINQVLKGPDKISGTAYRGGRLTIAGGRGYGGSEGGNVEFATVSASQTILTSRWIVSATNGSFVPALPSTYNIGSSALPVATIYTDYLELGKIITPVGTTGAQTINKAAGTVNFAAGMERLVVTNSFASISSIIQTNIASPDATMFSAIASAGIGAFELYAKPNNPTTETIVQFTLF